MKNRLIALLVLFTVIFFSTAQAQTTARKFEAGKNTFLLDGKPFVVKAAELHYTRIPQAYWEHRIEMCKALGMNTICIYIFWNIHEQEEGKFDFSGQNDIAAFCITDTISQKVIFKLCSQIDYSPFESGILSIRIHIFEISRVTGNPAGCQVAFYCHVWIQ